MSTGSRAGLIENVTLSPSRYAGPALSHFVGEGTIES
jgi:hypothetical protein